MVRHIDFMIIGLSLIGTLVIGIYYGRGIKTFQEYAVGNRKMATSVLAISLVATVYGGRFLHETLDDYYRQGFERFMKSSVVMAAILYLFSRLIMPRMKEFMGHLSIAESMESLKNWQDKLLYQAKTKALIARFWENAVRFHLEAAVQAAAPSLEE